MVGRTINPNIDVAELEAAGVFEVIKHPVAAKEYIGEALWHLSALQYHFDKFIDLACNKQRQLATTGCVPMEAEVVSFIFCLHSLVEGIPYGVAICLHSSAHKIIQDKISPQSYSWKHFNNYLDSLPVEHELIQLKRLIHDIRFKEKGQSFSNKQYDLLSEFANAIKHRHPIRLTLPQHLQSDLHYRMSSKERGESELIFKQVVGYESSLCDGANVMNTLVEMHDNLVDGYLHVRDELLSLMKQLAKKA